MKQTDLVYLERKIVIAMISSKEFLDIATNIIDLKFVNSKEAELIMSWCFEYYRKYKKAPKDQIQDIYLDKVRETNIPKKKAQLIEEILDSLSDEYENTKINIEYLKDQTVTYSKICKINNYIEDIHDELDSGNVLEAEALLSTYQPPEDIKSNAVIPLQSTEQIKDAFKQATKPLIRLPGDLGDLMNMSLTRESFVAIMGQSKGGKALKNGTHVLTDGEWKAIEDLKTGDIIFNREGKKAKVTGVYPQKGLNKCYRFYFNDGSFIDSDINHIWYTLGPSQRFDKRKATQGQFMCRTTEEIIKQVGTGIVDYKKRHLFPTTKPIQFSKKKLEIDPYVLGVLLGDGCFRSKQPSITNPDKQIINEIKNKGYILLNGNNGITYTFKVKSENTKVTRNGTTFLKNKIIPKEKYRIKTHLINLNLWGKKSEEKHIPKKYLFSSVKDRTELLYGLMDTDGYIDERGKLASYSTSSEVLKDNIMFLIRSLGGRCSVSSKIPKYTHNGESCEGLRSYRISIKMNQNMFKLKRKAERFKQSTKTLDRILVKTKYIGKHKTTCISTSSPDKLFITKDCIVTHNTWFLWELAKRAAKQNKKVVFIQSGDMSQAQMERRQAINLAKKSDIKKYCGLLYVPVLDCIFNQNGDCDKRIRENPDGEFPFDGMSFKKVRNISKEDLIQGFKENKDHMPCYNCKRKQMGGFRGTIWYKERKPVKPLTWKESSLTIRRKHRKLLNNIRLVTYPSETLTNKMMNAEIDLLDKMGFTPDVVVLDYIDLNKPDYDTRNDSSRDKINSKWQRGRKFSQERKLLFITGTQSDAQGFNKMFLGKDNFNNDRRILDHVTAMFGINMTVAEKKKGIYRINDIVGRETEGGSFVHVMHRLQMGQPMLGSYY